MNVMPADQQNQTHQDNTNSYVDDYTPPTSDTGNIQTGSDSAANSFNSDENSLEAQNIFFLLGADDATDELKEKFLDQLQEVIWDDFLENDIDLLLTQEEMPKFLELKRNLLIVAQEEREKAKDDLVAYLESLIPDLEDIMLEKALDLKADLFVERIAGLKEYFSDKPETLKVITDAETLMFEDNWKESAEKLNTLSEDDSKSE